MLKALKRGQQNFVITDPRLPDNPIVYASQGFLDITGYSLEQVLGRNCRFIQGPETDVNEVAKVRNAIAAGVEISVCLLNYKINGESFWNQVHIAPLRNQHGEIVNFVGVQCEVPGEIAAKHTKIGNGKSTGPTPAAGSDSGPVAASGPSGSTVNTTAGPTDVTSKVLRDEAIVDEAIASVAVMVHNPLMGGPIESLNVDGKGVTAAPLAEASSFGDVDAVATTSAATPTANDLPLSASSSKGGQ